MDQIDTTESQTLDLKLLLFWSEDGNRNKEEAIAVIKAELQTCLFVERFEYFQKLVILELWLCSLTGESTDKVKELITMHLPNIKGDEQMVTQTFLINYVQELNACCQDSQVAECSFMHID